MSDEGIVEPTGTPEDDHGSHLGAPTGSGMLVVYVCALAAVVMGLYFGMRYDRTVAAAFDVSSRTLPRAVPAGVVPSMAYRDIEAGNLGPNADLKTRFSRTQKKTISVKPVTPGDLSRKQSDLVKRAERRAYNGAPPTIPHRIPPRDVTSCITCHGPSGMTIGNVVASPMPHRHYASCTQCHVPTQALAADEKRWLDNAFEGLPAPTAGARAYPGAPPVIPHSTTMRSNCTSCHGPTGAEGLRSSHPWRASCTQCHAPWGARDAHPGARAESPLFLPAHELDGGRG